MPLSLRFAAPAVRSFRPSPAARNRFSSTSAAATTTTEQWPQRTPLGPYYEAILRHPMPSSNPKPKEPPLPAEKPHLATLSPSTSPPGTAVPQPTPPPQSPEEKARIIFGSRLLGPEDKAERQAAIQTKSQSIAGVLVPPKPEEPDNCCMSGCVNCVWELFREEMEEWNAKNSEAQRRLAESAGSVDADGAGSEANWVPGDAKIAKDLWEESVFESVPVGIREFMKQEKRLKEKHEREGTVG